MSSLELKIPPPIVAFLVAVGMWGIARLTPSVDLSSPFRTTLAFILAAIGVCFDLTGIVLFLRTHTTINPTRPRNTSALVCSGIYRLTRNPMYVGLVFFLTAWLVDLASPYALMGPLVFVLYIQQFQIIPEERALTEKFGAQYVSYQSQVRRWL
jgi:protein-S-isoprenylcysteine O-methyltransferase Ste14